MVELVASHLRHNARRAFLHRQAIDQTELIDLGVEAHGGGRGEIGVAPAGADLPVLFMGEAAPADEEAAGPDGFVDHWIGCLQLGRALVEADGVDEVRQHGDHVVEG
jgi:hypothetical protein